MTTYTILNIDGVVSAYLPSDAHKEVAGHSGEWMSDEALMTSTSKKYPITWNTDVITFLNAVIGQTTLVVGSEWRNDALTKIFPLVGLDVPTDPVVLDADGMAVGYLDKKNGEWWKAVYLKKFLESTGPDDRFVWIDYLLSREFSVRPITDILGGRILLVAPSIRIGLTSQHMDLIDNFLAKGPANV